MARKKKNENPFGEACQREEELGRTVGAYCLMEFLKDYNYDLSLTDLTSPVDLKGNLYLPTETIPFNVEIKQRNKTPEQLMNYPNCELRTDKYLRMLLESPSAQIIYIVLLNKSDCYLFNLRNIDMYSLEIFNWQIRQIQTNEKSEYKVYPTFSIPTSLALAKIDCSKYYNHVETSGVRVRLTLK